MELNALAVVLPLCSCIRFRRVQIPQPFPLPMARQAAVTVAGFPIGGDSFCLTTGVVSRVEMIEYSHSGRSLAGLQVT
jgi:hypothetical protein